MLCMLSTEEFPPLFRRWALSHTARLVFAEASVPFASPAGHTVSQAPHPMQSVVLSRISGRKDWDSGLWHHGQCSVHPFRNTVVRMPGPSPVQKCWMSKMVPFMALD